MRINRQNISKIYRNLRWQIDIPYVHQGLNSTHVDLGAGNNPRNPFGAVSLVATDFHDSFVRHDGVKFVKSDLTRSLPFEHDSIDSFSAYDVLEHIPRWERTENGIVFPFISLMADVYRALKPGGLFIAVTPAYPSAAAFQDPTHINLISEGTIRYFAGEDPWAKSLGYGFECSFEIVTQCWLRGSGPFAPESLTFNLQHEGLKVKIIHLAKLAKRLTKLPFASNPSHLLWVLRKPL